MAIGEGTRDERDVRAIPAQVAQAAPPATGPERTRAALDALPPEWTLLHARHWPGRTYDTVDHVAIGPNGIFVVDSVGWSGDIEITPDVLQVNGRSRLAAVQGAHEAAREVALLLAPEVRDHVYPVICFSRDEAISGWVKAVRVSSTVTLNELIETREQVLSDDHARQIATDLDAALPSIQHTVIERSRATDLTAAGRPPTQTPVSRGAGAWRRSRAGRITEGALALGIVATVGFVGFHIVTPHGSSQDPPAKQHQPVSPHQKP